LARVRLRLGCTRLSWRDVAVALCCRPPRAKSFIGSGIIAVYISFHSNQKKTSISLTPPPPRILICCIVCRKHCHPYFDRQVSRDVHSFDQNSKGEAKMVSNGKTLLMLGVCILLCSIAGVATNADNCGCPCGPDTWCCQNLSPRTPCRSPNPLFIPKCECGGAVCIATTYEMAGALLLTYLGRDLPEEFPICDCCNTRCCGYCVSWMTVNCTLTMQCSNGLHYCPGGFYPCDYYWNGGTGTPIDGFWTDYFECCFECE